MAKYINGERVDDISKLPLIEQSVDPSTPVGNRGTLYYKNRGLYFIQDDETIIGPLSDIKVSAPTQTGSFLKSGGLAVWETDLVFRVSTANYYIDSIPYVSAEQTIELDAADDTNPRIDVIALDTSGIVVKISGEPGATPSKPDIDPATQLELTFVLIPALATAPSGITNTDLYLENAGTPTEWGATDSGATIDVNSANNPRTGTKCIELTSAANSNWFLLTDDSTTSLANQETLVFFVRSKSAWPSNKSMRLAFRNSGVVQGNFVTFDDGLFGFSSAVTGSYQQIAIPISQFSVPGDSLVDELVFEIRGGGVNIGAYFDDIILQGGTEQVIQQGISQAQADTRYLRTANNLNDLSDNDLARINLNIRYATIETIILANDEFIDLLDLPFNGEITKVTLGADITGSISVHILTDSSFPPTTNITGGNEPTITSGIFYQDSTLTNWSKNIVEGNNMRLVPSGIVDINKVTASLRVRRT